MASMKANETNHPKAQTQPAMAQEMQEPEIVLKRRTMRDSIKEGGLHATMEGFSEQFITPFALFLGASTQMIGFLSAVPSLVGSFVQLFSDRFITWWPARSKLMATATIIQACLWLPLLALPFIPNSTILLIGIVTMISIIGMVQSPVWNSVMGDIVPSHERGRYFGKRTSVITLVLFSSVFAAGMVLNYAKGRNSMMIGFMVVFFVAFLAKFLSVKYKREMYDPPHPLPEPKTSDFWNFMRNITATNYGRFLMYMFILKIALGFSAPFFAVYELRDLQFTYLQFTLVGAVSILTSFMSLKWWGSIIDKYGSRNTLLVTGFLLPFMPLVWVIYPHFGAIFAVEALSGVVWGGFNLSASNFIFDASVRKNRASYVSYFNFFGGIGFFIGAGTAGWLSQTIPIIPMISELSRIPIYLLISAALRLLAAALFLSKLSESRLIEIGFEKTFWNLPLGRHLFIMPSGSTVLEIGGTKGKLEVPPPQHASVHPKHFDYRKHEPIGEDEAFVQGLLEKSGARPARQDIHLIGKEALTTTPQHDETPAVDHLLEDIRKGKFVERNKRRKK